MDTRKYKEKNISLLGLGAMRLPTIDNIPKNIDKEKAEALLAYAFDKGINYVDTAYMYHEGAAEPFLGKALKKYPRNSYYLATKMPVWFGKTLDDIKRIFAEQLDRLQTDYFDFYLCHNLTKEFFSMTEQLKVYDFLAEKKEEGVIKELGFSFHDTPSVLEKIIKAYPWDFAQIQLNYVDWTFQNAKEQYSLLCENNLPVIIMEPVRGGALATLTPEAQQILKEIQPNQSIASWAIRYAAQLPNVITVLSGMTNMEQLEDNISTLSPLVPLTDRENDALETAKKEYQKTKTIPCTGCNYCIDCKHKVDIPKLFAIANNHLLGASDYTLQTSYESIKRSNRESNCTLCGNCMKKCPQNIHIPNELERVGNMVQESYHRKK